jgi:hypothetical protein
VDVVLPPTRFNNTVDVMHCIANRRGDAFLERLPQIYGTIHDNSFNPAILFWEYNSDPNCSINSNYIQIKSSNSFSMTILYVLKLKHECYYVGTTQHPITNRVKMHLSGFGSKWTRIHPPIALVKQMYCADHDYNHDSSKHSRNESHNRNTNHNSKTVINLHIQPRILEDMHVKHLMFEFGIDHVRGGSYSKCDLSSMEVQALRRELWYARNCCTRCGRHRKERDRCSGAGVLGVGIGSCRISLGSKSGLVTGSVPVSVRGCRAERDVNGLLISTANTGTTVDEDEYEDDASLQVDIKDEDVELIGIRKGACGVDNGCRSCCDPSLPARGSPTRTRGSFTKPNSLLNDGAKLRTVPMTKRTPLDFCTRCKRSGHTRPDCNETSDRFGFDLTDFMF